MKTAISSPQSFSRINVLLSVYTSARTTRHYGTPKYACLALLVILFLSSCSSATVQESNPLTPADSAYAQSADDREAISAQQAHLIKAEITVTAPVKKLLRDDNEGLPHQKFLILLSNGSTILVAHNTRESVHLPIQPGDIVTIHGEYIWNKLGGIIHWTHHSNTPKHESGWVECHGRRYE